jgi:transmembrane sensor
MSMQHTSLSKKRRHQVAVHWLVSLQADNVSDHRLRRWQKWISSPLNQQAFDAVTDLWRALDQVVPPAMPSNAGSEADACAVREEASVDPPNVSLPVARRRRATSYVYGASAFIAVVCIGLAMFYVPQLKEMWAPLTVYETAVGKDRIVVLRDGSQIKLGGHTLLRRFFDSDSRVVVLDRGEALFTVADDSSRPFKVVAGGGEVTALGTAFNVRRLESGDVIVTVTKGAVVVGPNEDNVKRLGSDGPSLTQRVTRGYEVSYDERGNVGPARLADLETSLSWLNGFLQYVDEPLSRVVADVNRYAKGKVIVLGDPASGKVLYTGTVFKDKLDIWFANLGDAYPEIEVVPTDDAHVLIRSRSEKDADEIERSSANGPQATP